MEQNKKSVKIPKEVLTIRNYVKAGDIPTNSVVVIIDVFTEDTKFIDKETKQEIEKTNYVIKTEYKGNECLINCNKKTLIRLTEDFNSDDMTDWIGKKVRLLNMEDSGYKYILLVAEEVANKEEE
jgi:hypothetical protein